MKHSILRKVGAVLLIVGIVLAVPVYAAKHGGPGMMDGKGGPGSQQMSGMMHDMSGEMKEMSGAMGKGNMNADMQKQMAKQMKEMAGMMENMSGMMGKGMMMDAGMQKQMGQMRKQMDQMMKDKPASPAKKK
ncbi:MAG TPA: hypothetical protein VJB18_08425 [Burkholderiales bacterium]|nr:hypothetical protein [Burkholderiales bacterium]